MAKRRKRSSKQTTSASGRSSLAKSRKAVRKGRKRTSRSSKRAPLPESGSFLRKSHTAVRSHLSSAQSLPQFLGEVGDLTLANKRALVEQALVLIEDNYVHLPLKAAMHAVEPVQRLKTTPASYRTIRERLSISSRDDRGFQFTP